jgi:hypothetical protein
MYISTRAIVNGNLAYRSFGGVNIHLWHNADIVTIANNTAFTGNVGILVGSGEPGVAGGIHNCRIFNNIIRDCTYGVLENGVIGTGNLYDHDLINNCTTSWSIAGSHTNDLSADPLMVNYIPAGGGDYHLTISSPAKDVGVSSLGTSPTAFAPIVDIDATSRPQNTTYDLGAYEFIQASSGGSVSNAVLGSTINSNKGNTIANRTISL